MKITPLQNEVAELDKQDPSTASKGGFQGLVVSLQKKVDRATGELLLSADDLRRIPMYAFDFKDGGFQNTLLRVFGRTLGPRLGR